MAGSEGRRGRGSLRLDGLGVGGVAVDAREREKGGGGRKEMFGLAF